MDNIDAGPNRGGVMVRSHRRPPRLDSEQQGLAFMGGCVVLMLLSVAVAIWAVL